MRLLQRAALSVLALALVGLPAAVSSPSVAAVSGSARVFLAGGSCGTGVALSPGGAACAGTSRFSLLPSVVGCPALT